MRARCWAWCSLLALAACAGATRGQGDSAWQMLPSPVGRESWLLAQTSNVFASVASSVDLQRDACGSLIVRRAGDTSPVRLLVAVGVDEAGYVVSQIRDDGLLRVRTVGMRLGEAFHLAREGRPVTVFTRNGDVPGVILVSSLHLRAPRPDVLDESSLYLDIGADSPADVAAMGVELLDAVGMHESARLAGGRSAGPSAGTRSAAQALAAVTLAAASGDGLPVGVAVAFVAQSQVGISLAHDQQPVPAPLGRGGEAVVRRLQPAETIVLRVADGLPGAVDGPGMLTGSDTAWKSLDLRVRNAGTPVEVVDDADAQILAARLWELVGAKGAAPDAKVSAAVHGSFC